MAKQGQGNADVIQRPVKTTEASEVSYLAALKTKTAEGTAALKTKTAAGTAALKTKTAAGTAALKTKTAALKTKTQEIASEPGVQVAFASAVGGGVVVGAGGAATGLVTGGALGAAIGILPALFTFGLSIPLGAVVGAGCGVTVGGVVGGTTGFTGGGAIGYGAYKKRTEIRGLIAAARQKLFVLAGSAQAIAVTYATKAKTKAKVVTRDCTMLVALMHGKVSAHARRAKTQATDALQLVSTKIGRIVSNKDVQATAASATGGAVVLGSGGAVSGLVVGGALGAAVGVVPAIFTFGLSIPVMAVVGSGVGVAAGSVVGGTSGAVAGAGAYGVYTKREAIGSRLGSLANKARSAAKSYKAKLTSARE